MLPYSATDVVRVMSEEMKPADERRFGAHIARDIQRDEDHDVDRPNRPERGERVNLRLNFLRGAVLSRGF